MLAYVLTETIRRFGAPKTDENTAATLSRLLNHIQEGYLECTTPKQHSINQQSPNKEGHALPGGYGSPGRGIDSVKRLQFRYLRCSDRPDCNIQSSAVPLASSPTDQSWRRRSYAHCDHYAGSPVENDWHARKSRDGRAYRDNYRQHSNPLPADHSIVNRDSRDANFA